MKSLFTTLKGFLVLLQVVTLIVNFAIYNNYIAGEPGKVKDKFY